MKEFELYNKTEFIKFAKTALFAMSFLGTVTLTGCNDKSETKKETTSIETVAPTKKPTVVESTITYETERKAEETLVVETTMPETIEIPVVESLPETTVEQSGEGAIDPENEMADYQLPDEPESFANAEALVSYIENVTRIAELAVANNNKEALELQAKKVTVFDWKKNQFEHSQPWSGFKYSKLTEEQKTRVKNCRSIIAMIGKDHFDDAEKSAKDFHSRAVESSLYETAQEKGSQTWEKAKEIGGKLGEKAKTKVKEYLK